MPQPLSYDVFVSPFTWRYGSDAMRSVWSETKKRRIWRRIWVEIARVQQQVGLVTAAQVADLVAHMDDIDIARAEAIEAEIHHDLMAEVRTYAEQCHIGGGIIHLGATSADIEDNADALRLRESMNLILDLLSSVLSEFSTLINRYADHPAIAFTHLQPAEPTTIGYRLSLYAQDLLEDWQSLNDVNARLRGKGFKGAVGTGASYQELLGGTKMSPAEFEAKVMSALQLAPYPIAAQTYPRKQDWQVLSALSGVAGSLYKFAFDLRLLQSPVIGEWHEGFEPKQVGSSAMPFKRNPINAEKMDSLGRLVNALVQSAWDNASHSLLERTLDDSANRREILPVAFLAVDEMLLVCGRILSKFRVDEAATARNLAQFGVFAASERLLMTAVKRGADRQLTHEHMRELSMAAWAVLAQGQPNPLANMLVDSPFLNQYLLRDEILDLLQAEQHIGDAAVRARAFAAYITTTLQRG
jgi:adenylosuccinate lyase